MDDKINKIKETFKPDNTKYRYKRTVDAIKLEKGMDIPDWLVKGVGEGKVTLRGISKFTRDEPYCVVSNLVAKHNIHKGYYIVHDDGYYYAKCIEEFEQDYEKVEQ
jgi:hypothetical protein